jgi:hypothetical protein
MAETTPSAPTEQSVIEVGSQRQGLDYNLLRASMVIIYLF